MDTYLLDTNLVSVFYDSSRSNHHTVRQVVATFDPQAPQLISTITIAELRFGLALSQAAGTPLNHIQTCIQRAEQHPLVDIDRHTANAYAHVKSSIAIQRMNIRSRIPRWVETWTDRITGQHLQIDENDLWIAAQAVEKNLVVVTSDQGFSNVIAPAVPEIRVHLV